MSNEKRSPVHEIVNALWRALHDLGKEAKLADIERWGFSIHMALSAPGREYHNHDHVVALTIEGDALEVIAALYHDSVYIQVDQDLPLSMKAELKQVLAHEEAGWRILPSAAGIAGDTLAVFGRKIGDIVTPLTGLNEIASALVASIHLKDTLTREQRIAIAACIEQTIPFRADPVTPLQERLVLLGFDGKLLDETMRRAVRLGNRDVENFADNDPALFLDNTWKLLPESNPALHAPLVYSVRDYRTALQKMEGFLSKLPAERVFHHYQDEPKHETYARHVARTTGNLELAGRYLRAKLFAIAVIEAVADVTGGDVPIDYFMGASKQFLTRVDLRRIEQFLPQLARANDVDASLHHLLAEGRASESSFDTGPSPISTFLYAAVGEAEIMKGIDKARVYWAGGYDGNTFLQQLPPKPIAGVARAAGNIVDTRRDRLFALAERLER
jgi:hypothetical protein